MSQQLENFALLHVQWLVFSAHVDVLGQLDFLEVKTGRKAQLLEVGLECVRVPFEGICALLQEHCISSFGSSLCEVFDLLLSKYSLKLLGGLV